MGGMKLKGAGRGGLWEICSWIGKSSSGLDDWNFETRLEFQPSFFFFRNFEFSDRWSQVEIGFLYLIPLSREGLVMTFRPSEQASVNRPRQRKLFKAA